MEEFIMASRNISTKTTAQRLSDLISKYYAKKSDLTDISSAASAAIKSVNVSGNTVSFYTSADKSGNAVATVDFPKELFLDQTKTEFVPKFKWAEATYPGSTNPSLDNKPVMVLAVKGTEGTEETITYSFLSMSALVDTYVAKSTGKDASTTVTIADYEVEVKVNISAESGNQLTLKDDGLFVPAPEAVDLSGKVDKEEGKGLSANDFTNTMKDKLDGIAEGATKVESSETNGNIKVNGTETNVYTLPDTVLTSDDLSDYTEAELREMLGLPASD
jgi:hypothetical protein